MDIGGTKVAAGVVDERGTIVATTHRDTPADDVSRIEDAIVAAVRDKIRELIADLVGRLISYAAELAATAGLAAPLVAEQAISLIAKWAAKIADLITRLLCTVKALMPLLRHLDEIFDAIKKAMAAIPEDTSLALTVLSTAKNSLTTIPSSDPHRPASQSAISYARNG